MRRLIRISAAAGAVFLAGCLEPEAPVGDSGSSSDPRQLVEAGVERIDLNSASAAELETLPGIGDVIAQRIVEGRPFETVDDVLRVEGLGEGTLKKIREFVVAK